MQLMDEAGMMDEKNLEYFKRVVEEREGEENKSETGDIDKGV